MTFHACGKRAATVQASGLVMMGEECQIFFFLIHYHPLKPAPDQTHIHRLGCTRAPAPEQISLPAAVGSSLYLGRKPWARGSLHPTASCCRLPLLPASASRFIFTLPPCPGASLYQHCCASIAVPASLVPASLCQHPWLTCSSARVTLSPPEPQAPQKQPLMPRVHTRDAGHAWKRAVLPWRITKIVFFKDESVLKCQTNFPYYLPGHSLPGSFGRQKRNIAFPPRWCGVLLPITHESPQLPPRHSQQSSPPPTPVPRNTSRHNREVTGA